jgi:dipicolinate synthase subunit A
MDAGVTPRRGVSMTGGLDLHGKRVAVLAGDERMLEIMRLARSAGAEVVAFASAPGAETASGSPVAGSLDEALTDADLIVCPVPGLGPDDGLWTPNAVDAVKLTSEALGRARRGAQMFMGRVSEGIAAVCEPTGVRPVAHGDDDVEALLHAIPTAEGAVYNAIELSDITLMSSHCVCTGFGRVGQSMAVLLRGMGANVTLCARNEFQRARATGFGLRALPLSALADELVSADFCFQSAPGQDGYVLTREILAAANPEIVIIELSSPPSGTDLEACSELGLTATWARGQAGTAPRTAGADEWQVIARMYVESQADA